MKAGMQHAACLLLALVSGCATMKESDTARTGTEQMLISSAVDRSLDKVDFSAVRGAKVYIDEKYLDCVDKNYVFVALHQRLLANGCTLLEKEDDADVVVQVGSGAVGTDRQELFFGIPEIPLPPPSPIAIPKLAFISRTRGNGTAKLIVLAYDAKTKRAVINSAPALARSDYKSWKVLGGGPFNSGSVPTEIAAATGEGDGMTISAPAVAQRRPAAPR